MWRADFGEVIAVAADRALRRRHFTSHPAISSALQARIVSIFMKGTVKPEQRAQLADEIARTPGVREFAFVSKHLTMMRLLERLGDLVWVRSNPLPASFEIVVKSRGDVLPVARRFFNNPFVRDDPGTHDGVGFALPPTSR